MKKKLLWISLAYICFILTACNNNAENPSSQTKNNVTTDSLEIIETVTNDNQEIDLPDETTYDTAEYGEIREYGGEFYFDENNKGYYYNLECFYLNSEFLYTMNETLEKIYDKYLEQYLQTEDWYMEQGQQDLPNVPYSKLQFLGIKYIDNDYVSLLFDDITHMGSATAYSFYDAITLDRHTGAEVSASEILEMSDTEILETVNELMGLDEDADWNDLDFYLEDKHIVFFYRMPGIWEDVILDR